MNANYYRCPPNCNTSRQGVRLARSSGRRAATDSPTFQECKPQAPRSDPEQKKYQFDTLEECKAANTQCFGPNKAYSYVCGADASQPPQIAYSPDGKEFLTEVNCYDCKDNQCAFAGGTGNTVYNTMQACNDDSNKKCGWKYGCTA